MSTVLSTLQAGGLRDLLSTVGSLATWKTLALILAIINLKNLPFVWHVSSSARFKILPSTAASSLGVVSQS